MFKPKRVLSVLLVCGCVAIPLAGASPASAGHFTNKCGDGLTNGAGWWNLKTIRTACRVARTLADHYVFKAGGNDDGFKNWNCREKQIGDEVWRVNCHRNKDGKFQRVRFLYGA
ncbi:MAG: hypothetical protein ABWY90_05405 [Solirubrobacterales bacterium]